MLSASIISFKVVVRLAHAAAGNRAFMRRISLLYIPAAIAMSTAVPVIAQEEVNDTPPVATFSALYTADLWTNAAGGVQRGHTYLDNLDLVATYDADRGIGLRGTTALVSLLYNNRSTFSDRFAGDLQTISNIDTDGALRLYEAWIDHDFGAGRLKLGLIDFNSEFDINETGSLFVNSSHGIGPELSQVGANGPGIFPVPALGARVLLGSEKIAVKLGVFEGIPGDPEHPHQTVIRLQNGEGVLSTLELNWRPVKTVRLAGGVWQHSGSPIAGLGAAYGGHAIAEARVSGDATRSLSAFARVGMARGDVYELGDYVGAGVAFSAPLFMGEDEQLGLAVGSAGNAGFYRRERQAAQQPVEARETVLELTYRTRLTPWLAVQPDLQYIFNPGTDPNLDDAIAIGLRLEIGWSTAK